jgi:hypothetical protein
MRRLLNRYEGRLADPALRPAGALPVEWTVFAAPVPSELAVEDPATGPGHAPRDGEEPAAGAGGLGATESE